MTTGTDFTLELRYGLDIVSWCRECVKFRPDPWQERVLSTDAAQTLLNISRQAGKSTVCALRAAHQAIYRPGTLTLLISRGQRQASEIFLKVSSVFRQLGIRLRVDNQASCELMNGSRVVSLPGDAQTIRGYSPQTVIFDEAGFVPDEVYNSVRPMLSVTRGQLFLISTPNGRAGFFHDEWFHGGPGWYRELVPASECPRISAEFLAAERQRRGLWFRQEYACEFTDGTAQLFSHELIASLFSEPFPALELRYFT